MTVISDQVHAFPNNFRIMNLFKPRLIQEPNCAGSRDPASTWAIGFGILAVTEQSNTFPRFAKNCAAYLD